MRFVTPNQIWQNNAPSAEALLRLNRESRMLLQTNSYVVPKEKRAEHARLLRKFKQTLHRLGCDHFEVYEQVGSNWSGGETSGRFVQIMRFRDRKQQLAVQAAERNDESAQQLIAEFCELINFPYQQQQGLFAVGFYHSALPIATGRGLETQEDAAAEPAAGEQQPQAESEDTSDAEPAPEVDAEDVFVEDTPVEDTPVESEDASH